LQKQVHVNAYVKKDGTEVKEHYRTIDTDILDTPPTIPEMEDATSEKNNKKTGNPLEDLLNKMSNPSMNLDAGPILQGGISMDSGIGDLLKTMLGNVIGSMGEVLGSVVMISVELAPIALEIYKAINSNNKEDIKELKPQFNTRIKQLDTQVSKIEQTIDKYVTQLANAKDKTEYSKAYE